MVSTRKIKERTRKKDNPELVELVTVLRKKGQFWQDFARELAKPRRQEVKVNLAKISENVKDGDIVVVPGKVLGSGDLSKNVTLGAFSFSASALSKVKATKIEDLKKIADSHKDGKGVKVIV